MPFVGQFGDSATSPLGIRGIRLSLARAELLETQFRASTPRRAPGRCVSAADGHRRFGNPRCSRCLGPRGPPSPRRVDIPTALPPLGTMIEVPGAALTADALALVSDFPSGSNDLTMPRGCRPRRRAGNPCNPLHPSAADDPIRGGGGATRPHSGRVWRDRRRSALLRRCCSALDSDLSMRRPTSPA